MDYTTTKEQVWNDSARHGENNDCTVKAVTIATGLDYDTVHAAFAKFGRRPNRGVRRDITRKATEYLGFSLEPVENWTAKTAITIERDRRLQSGRYVIGMTKHLAAMVDGNLVDWSDGTRKRVNAVYQVIKMQAAPQPAAVAFVPFAAAPEQLRMF